MIHGSRGRLLLPLACSGVTQPSRKRNNHHIRHLQGSSHTGISFAGHVTRLTALSRDLVIDGVIFLSITEDTRCQSNLARRLRPADYRPRLDFDLPHTPSPHHETRYSRLPAAILRPTLDSTILHHSAWFSGFLNILRNQKQAVASRLWIAQASKRNS
ncbi:hypothetical protein NliqN6_6419 [Naganishia liquefaciens]|uniref:Uncharacterized protein n=1 Tax=Naganishia liquefaciens TaxID=104408 RepID=A0A8H3TZM6_9TREE|nr:hypothetical protein NliqN6_6419 [Naganishia liquefaciens]